MPSGAKSERTRERIILAAAVTLSRLGYAGTRLSDVAGEAGVHRGGSRGATALDRIDIAVKERCGPISTPN